MAEVHDDTFGPGALPVEFARAPPTLLIELADIVAGAMVHRSVRVRLFELARACLRESHPVEVSHRLPPPACLDDEQTLQFAAVIGLACVHVVHPDVALPVPCDLSADVDRVLGGGPPAAPTPEDLSAVRFAAFCARVREAAVAETIETVREYCGPGGAPRFRIWGECVRRLIAELQAEAAVAPAQRDRSRSASADDDAEKLRGLHPRFISAWALRRYAQEVWPDDIPGGPEGDPEAFHRLKEHGTPDGLKLPPSLDTFGRYLRECRRALFGRASARKAPGRSVAGAAELNPEDVPAFRQG